MTPFSPHPSGIEEDPSAWAPWVPRSLYYASGMWEEDRPDLTEADRAAVARVLSDAGIAVEGVAREAVRDLVERLPQLRYVWVEEAIDDELTLIAAGWPFVDDEGWRRWTSNLPRVRGHTTRGELQAFLDVQRAGSVALGIGTAEAAVRPVRVGDVFCAGLGSASAGAGLALELVDPEGEAGEGRLPEVGDGQILALVSVAPDPATPWVVDLTGDAHDASQASYYASIAPTLDPERDADLIEMADLTAFGVSKEEAAPDA